MRELQTNSHCENLILYHLIFVCKYRRKCFSNTTFAEALKLQFSEIAKKYDFEIDTSDTSVSDNARKIIDMIKNEVEYFDIVNLLIISLFFIFRISKYLGITFIVIVIIWGVIEFGIYGRKEEMVMKIGIVDFFYISLFLVLFFKSVMVTENVILFAIFSLTGMSASGIMALVYTKIRNTNMVPYLFVMYPMLLSVLLLQNDIY